jgi:hypothetical protein
MAFGVIMKTFIAVLLALAIATPALAQDRREGAVEGLGGWAGFVDEDAVNHGIFGAAAKWSVSPRVALGPEVIYMIGPGTDRDLVLTGNVTFDLLARGSATPFFVAGGGLFRHSNQFFGDSFSSTEGAFTAGGGVRIAVTDRFYIAPQARIGWEPHLHLSVAAGYRF